MAKYVKDTYIAFTKLCSPRKITACNCSKNHNEILHFAKSGKYSLQCPEVKFDSDSFQIGIDNHITACLSPSLEDFVGPITPSTCTIKGIAECLPVKGTGTICWKIQDDTGENYEIII